YLIHGPFVVMHSLHHTSEDRVKELPGILGVALGEQLHRAFQVCKENGDLFPLAFESTPRRKDLLLQVQRGVGCRKALVCGWCRDKRSGGRVRGKSYPTFTTEQALRRERGTTCRAYVL